MSHLGNKLKSGFFAFPERQGNYLSQLLYQEGETAAWLDPTCGEGKILDQLARKSQSEACQINTYGVELDKGRYELAETALSNVVNAPIESMVISNDSFSLVFLNPPYDWSIKGMDDKGNAERKEYTELQRNTRYIKPGGILIYVIPSYRFADKSISRFLASHFEESTVMRFTDEDYFDFRQCIFIGRRKNSKIKKTNRAEMEFYLNMDDEDFIMSNVPPMDDFISERVWSIPEGSLDIKTFYSKIETKDKYYDGILKSSGFEAYINRTKPRVLETGGDPVLPINQGQMALLLASGAINGLLGSGESLHLIQGLENVEKVKEVEETIHDNGSSTIKTVERTKRSVSVKFLTPRGIIKKLQ